MRHPANCENCGNRSKPNYIHRAKDLGSNVTNKKEGWLVVCDRCHKCLYRRKDSLDKILTSDADKKLIVAGAGTGKTHTFKKLLKRIPHQNKAIVFTLINNLADDLQDELSELNNENIKASTFHAFCRSLLHSKVRPEDLSSEFEYFPDLPSLIQFDAGLLGHEYSTDDFHKSFATQANDESQAFYIDRASYYDAASHDDAVYRVFSYFQDHPKQLPNYDLVIADEYQDLNALEAAFIELLTRENKVLIAGDDDQALYSFRNASTKFIRDLHDNDEYDKFSLPYCSRGTPTLVEAANHFVEEATSRGLLAGRVPRAYESYWPDKYRDEKKYSSIPVAQCKSTKAAWKYVLTRIVELADQEGLNGTETDLQFLVIHPEQHRFREIHQYLTDHLDSDRFYVEELSTRPEMKIEDGYRLIQQGNENLGWRIITHFENPPDLAEIIAKTQTERTPLADLLPKDYKQKHRESIDGDTPEDEEQDGEAEDSALIRVKVTNLFGSKGLSSLHRAITESGV